HDAFFWNNFSFLREMDALMQTRTSNGTVNVQDVVFDDEQHRVYIVMDKYDKTLLQYIHSASFEDRLEQLPFITTQLILALCDLDKKGIGHRDIKPSNILLNLLVPPGSQMDSAVAMELRNMRDVAKRSEAE